MGLVQILIKIIRLAYAYEVSRDHYLPVRLHEAILCDYAQILLWSVECL